MTIKTELYPEIDTTSSDLVDHNKSTDLNLRIMNILSGSSLLCVVMEELSDSFLVALPCKLVAYKDKKAVEPYLPVQFVRIMKPTVLMVMPCFGEFEAFYIDWLLVNGNNLFPEFIDELYLTAFKERFSAIKKEATALAGNLESIANTPEERKDDSSTPSIITPPDSKYKH